MKKVLFHFLFLLLISSNVFAIEKAILPAGQDVSSGAAPTLTGTNFTGIPTGGLLDDAITPAKVDETGNYQMNNLTLTGELTTASTCNPVTYGAYFDGSSHPVADVSAIAVLYDDDAWSGGDTYAQWARVVGSNGKIYLAHTAGGQAEDPTLDTNNTYWWLLFEDGDEADFVYTQMCHLDYGLTVVSEGIVNFADHTFIMPRWGHILKFLPSRAAYNRGPRIYTTGATNDIFVITARGVGLDGVDIDQQNKDTTRSDGAAVVINPKYINPANTATASFVTIMDMESDGTHDGFRFENGVGKVYINQTTLINNYGSCFIIDTGTSGDATIDNSLCGGITDKSKITTSTIGIEVRSGEQWTFRRSKVYESYYPVRFTGTAGDSFMNLYLDNDSFEHFKGDGMTNAGLGGTARFIYVLNGTKFSGSAHEGNDLTSGTQKGINLSGVDHVSLSTAVLNSNSNGGAAFDNMTGLQITDSKIYWNSRGIDSDANGVCDTYASNPVDVTIGAGVTNAVIEGNDFADEYGVAACGARLGSQYIQNYIEIADGATRYTLGQNSFGNLSNSSPESIDNNDSTTTDSHVCGNIFEEGDDYRLNCTEVSDDTTPVLGGDLDIGAHNIEGVDATEFGYVDGVTSDIQTQFSDRVTGPASATNNGVAVFDGTTGKLIKGNSLVTADPSTGYVTSKRLSATNTSGVAAAIFTTQAAGDGGLKTAAAFKRDNSTTPTDNDGVAIPIQLSNDTPTALNAAEWYVRMEDVSAGTEDSSFLMRTYIGGTATGRFYIGPTGIEIRNNTTVLGRFDLTDGALSAKAEEHIDADAHTLTCLEMSGTILNNDGATADAIWTVPDMDACNGLDFAFVATEELAADVDIFLDANAANAFYLNGVAGTAGQYLCLEGTAGTEEMSVIGCLGVTNDGGVDLTCYSAGTGTWHLDDDATECDGL